MSVQLYLGDCLDVLPTLADRSVDLIATDPPYYRVKSETWDRQWDTPALFLTWMGRLADEWRRILKPNGSLYIFVSPQMAARVECLIGERFNVLNNIRWVKTEGWHKKAKKQELRSWLSPWEAIIFAEHYGADNIAKGESGYAAKCDELRGFVFEPLRAYLDVERRRAGVDKADCNVACGFSHAAGGMASRHYFSRSQWCLPTEAHYKALQALFNQSGSDYLRREYEDLRREYDYLRREYDYLRRPFFAKTDRPHTDVWTFPTVQAYRGKHVCEKPLALMEHVVLSSTRPGAVVLDCFLGSGTTGEACVTQGRSFIGIERDPVWFSRAQQRIDAVIPLHDLETMPLLATRQPRPMQTSFLEAE